jgi:hypothetical protein
MLYTYLHQSISHPKNILPLFMVIRGTGFSIQNWYCLIHINNFCNDINYLSNYPHLLYWFVVKRKSWKDMHLNMYPFIQMNFKGFAPLGNILTLGVWFKGLQFFRITCLLVWRKISIHSNLILVFLCFSSYSNTYLIQIHVAFWSYWIQEDMTLQSCSFHVPVFWEYCKSKGGYK